MRICDKISEYKNTIEASLDSDDLHHGTELLRLWIQKTIDDCMTIIRKEYAVKKYQSKPEIVEAIQFTGDNGQMIFDWVYPTKCMIYEHGQSAKDTMIIDTANGMTLVQKNDYVVKQDELFFVHTPTIFINKYNECE